MKRINLYHDLLVKQDISKSILSIKHAIDNELLYQSDKNKSDIKQDILSIQNVPGYLNLEYQTNLIKKTICQDRIGFVSNLTGYLDVDSYVSGCFKKRSSNIFNRLKRLETCFDISYSHFYGDVNKVDYESLMQSLHSMLVKRFNQKESTHYKLNEWNDLHSKTFKQIRNKQASLFVIYHDLKPIQITLQYHYKNILMSSVPSYDIDYQKFGLGNISKYKQIEWCFKNNYKICDNGYGDFEYKRRWSNDIYNYEHHVVFSNNSFKLQCLSKLEISKVKIKEYLKSRKVDVLLRSIKASLTKNNRPKKLPNDLDCEITNIPFQEINNNDWITVDWHIEKYAFLRKHIYNFLYINKQHINDITMLKNDQETNLYVIKGGAKFQKIIFNPVKT